MKVSIVIPCYNEEKWIEKTVAAALDQDYPDFEIILVNNASTDNTRKVLLLLQEKNPKLIKVVDEPRQGVPMAREAGRVAATGEIIACLDADCIPPTHWISYAVPYFADQHIVAVAGIYDYYDGPTWQRYGMLAVQMMFMSPVNTLIQKIKKRAAFVGGNVFIRASALEKAGGYNKVTTFYGDEVDTSSRILPFGSIEYVSTLIVKTSARRYRDFGFWNTQKKYDLSTWSSIGKAIIRQEEKIHPR